MAGGPAPLAVEPPLPLPPFPFPLGICPDAEAAAADDPIQF